MRAFAIAFVLLALLVPVPGAHAATPTCEASAAGASCHGEAADSGVQLAARNGTISVRASQASIPGGMDRGANGSFQCQLDGCALAGASDGQGPEQTESNWTWTVDTMPPMLLVGGEAHRNGTGVSIKPVRCELQRGCAEEHSAGAGPVALFGHSQGAIHGERIITPVGNSDTHCTGVGLCGASVVVFAGGAATGCSFETREPAKVEVPDLRC